MNNPKLGEFCFTIIGRADIEGSKKQRRYERLAATSQLSLGSNPSGAAQRTGDTQVTAGKTEREPLLVRPSGGSRSCDSALMTAAPLRYFPTYVALDDEPRANCSLDALNDRKV